MGGSKGKGVEEVRFLIVCQMCEYPGHTADVCPWVYTECRKSNCHGLRMLKSGSGGRKYFECMFTDCDGFEWLEDGIQPVSSASMEAPPSSTSSEATEGNTHASSTCYKCRQLGHWAKSCPWTNQKCPNGCKPPKKLLTSTKPWSLGLKFLKCEVCEDFEWLESAIERSKKQPIMISVQMSMDEFCDAFKRKVG